jgi:ribosomal protein L29
MAEKAKRGAVLGSIRESSDAELKDRKKRLEEELFQHRLKRYTNQLENTNLIRSTRREIAMVETVLSGRKVGSEKQAAKTEAKE